MTKKEIKHYTTSGTGGLYDYAPSDALKYKNQLKKHEVKVGNGKVVLIKRMIQKSFIQWKMRKGKKSRYLCLIIGEPLRK